MNNDFFPGINHSPQRAPTIGRVGGTCIHMIFGRISTNEMLKCDSKREAACERVPRRFASVFVWLVH